MNGYQYLIQRNRLMCQLEDELKRISDLPGDQKEAETKRLQSQFDLKLRELYAEVSEEYPGERRKKARPLEDSH